MAGRKKLPSKLKLLKGTYQNCRENQNEPEPDIRIPKAPDHIPKVALVEWGRISAQLEKLGLISDVSMSALAAYCDAYAEWVEVSEILNELCEKKGKIAKYLTTTTSKNVIQNPLIGIKHTAMKIMKDFLTEFGMTPASAPKVSGKKKEAEKKNRFLKIG